MRALIIDLNNFSRYPTLSVGYLTAILRQRAVDVDVLSPFSFGVHGFPRRVQEKPWQLYANFLSHWSAVTRINPVRRLRALLKNLRQPGGGSDSQLIVTSVQQALMRTPDVVLISAYTMYIDVCREIASLCEEQGIPVVVGGNTFVVDDIAAQWANIPGISAVYAGEPEFVLHDMVKNLSGKKSVSHIPGVYSAAGKNSYPAPPLEQLDRVPFPDFADFPWNSYPNRIVPIMTGRGCEWGRCTFCSDVLTSAGRRFRSRSLDNVLEEIAFQRARFDVDLFVFLDLKLNSDLTLWRGLAEQLPRVAPGIKWTASVHVDARPDNGLAPEDLNKAAAAGLVRVTCGLESGSQKVLNTMAKGMRIKRLAAYVKAASAAGISVRLTCIIGYPSEQPEDVDLTTAFIEEHAPYIERIMLNRFTNAPGTPVSVALEASPDSYPHIKLHDLDLVNAVVPHDNARLSTTAHLGSMYRLLKAINKINQKPLIDKARDFEGAF